MPMRPYGGLDDLQRMLEALMTWQKQQPASDYYHVGDVLWGFRREGQHLRLMRLPGYVRDLNPVVVAPDGTLAAYCIGWPDAVNKFGEIEPLGTRPAYTRMGLGRAIVVEVLRRMQAHGMENALVYGSTNNSRAVKLYKSSGFLHAQTVYNYYRPIP